MAGDYFVEQIDWINGLTGDERAEAGSVVAWQCIATTINELVKQFNDVMFRTTDQKLKRHCEVQLKKVIIGMLFEVNECFNLWTARLRKMGLLDDNIKGLKGAFEDSYRTDGIGLLKEIRNGVAFHFGESLTDPDAIVDLYTKIDRIPIDRLGKIVEAAHACGHAMRDRVMDSLSTTTRPDAVA